MRFTKSVGEFFRGLFKAADQRKAPEKAAPKKKSKPRKKTVKKAKRK